MSDVEYGKMFFNVFNIGYKHVFKGFFILKSMLFTTMVVNTTLFKNKKKNYCHSFIHSFIHPFFIHSLLLCERGRTKVLNKSK